MDGLFVGRMIKMSWENIVKETFPSKRFGGGQQGWQFETKNVQYDNYDSENNGWPEEGNCIVKWEFSFGKRDHGIREFGFYVYEIILQSNDYDTDDITITSKEHFFSDTDVDSYDKIWPTLVQIHSKQNGMADINVAM